MRWLLVSVMAAGGPAIRIFPTCEFCLYRDADAEGESCADHERYRQDDTGGGTLTVQNTPTIEGG